MPKKRKKQKKEESRIIFEDFSPKLKKNLQQKLMEELLKEEIPEVGK